MPPQRRPLRLPSRSSAQPPPTGHPPPASDPLPAVVGGLRRSASHSRSSPQSHCCSRRSHRRTMCLRRPTRQLQPRASQTMGLPARRKKSAWQHWVRVKYCISRWTENAVKLVAAVSSWGPEVVSSKTGILIWRPCSLVFEPRYPSRLPASGGKPGFQHYVAL